MALGGEMPLEQLLIAEAGVVGSDRDLHRRRIWGN
jgi:hypothetical protein